MHSPIFQIWISFAHDAAMTLAEDQKCVHWPTCMVIGDWFLLVVQIHLLQMIADMFRCRTARIGIIRTRAELPFTESRRFFRCTFIPLIDHNDSIVVIDRHLCTIIVITIAHPVGIHFAVKRHIKLFHVIIQLSVCREIIISIGAHYTDTANHFSNKLYDFSCSLNSFSLFKWIVHSAVRSIMFFFLLFLSSLCYARSILLVKAFQFHEIGNRMKCTFISPQYIFLCNLSPLNLPAEKRRKKKIN